MKPHRPPTAELLEEHSGFLHGLARSLVLDEQHAEDVVQETFAAALSRPPPAHVRLGAWLAGVTRNLALKRRRREGRLRRREQAGSRPEGTPPTVDVAARVEIQRHIAEAVATLDEPGRSAIVWRYFDGLPPAEIARMEGVSVRTVESRLRRARAVLRDRLDADYGGDRTTWCAVLLPILGLDVQSLIASSAAASTASTASAASGTTSSVAGATAASSTSTAAGSAGTLTAAAAIGATIVSTKLIVGVAAACVAGAFFVGRQFPATPTENLTVEETVEAPVEDEAPVLEADHERVINQMTASLDAARKLTEAMQAENKSLREQIEAAKASGHWPPETVPGTDDAAAGVPFLPEKYKKVIAGMSWEEAGEAAAKMVPLLEDLAGAFSGGKGVDQSIGIKIFQHNQKLQTVAVNAIAAKVPGGGENGAFTHPTVAINLIHSALKQAGVPVDEKQAERLREFGDRYLEDDARRFAGYNEETFELQKLIDECALKDKMFADIDGILTPEQRDVLHPESIRGRLGIDIYSSGTIWYGVSKAVDFTTRENLAEGVVELYKERGNLTDDEVALVRGAAKEWAEGFTDAFLRASDDPLAWKSHREAGAGMLAGWQKIEQARVAAQHQLALNKMLYELVGSDEEKTRQVRRDIRVYIPLKRPE